MARPGRITAERGPGPAEWGLVRQEGNRMDYHTPYWTGRSCCMCTTLESFAMAVRHGFTLISSPPMRAGAYAGYYAEALLVGRAVEHQSDRDFCPVECLSRADLRQTVG
jgi:hypothetical protein